MIYLLFEKGADIKLTANVLFYIVRYIPFMLADTKTLVIRKMICRNFYYLFRFLISHVTRTKPKLPYNMTVAQTRYKHELNSLNLNDS